MLYGWLEIGVSNNLFFTEQNNEDLILRTITAASNNKIILGNTDGFDVSGGMYIQDNKVGIHSTLPQSLLVYHSNAALYVDGTAGFKDTVIIGTSNPPSSSSNYNMYIHGGARIEGDLVVNGTMTNVDTAVQVTDQLDITNDGTGPAIIVNQTGIQPVALFKDDNVQVMKIVNGGNVSVGSQEPVERLDVDGSIRSTSNLYVQRDTRILGKVILGPDPTASNLNQEVSLDAVSLEVHTKDAILIPVGTVEERPSLPKAGHVRYNTTTAQFEGYGAGDAWGSLGGVKDTNNDTWIAAEEYPTSNDDTLRFITSNSEVMRITKDGLVGIHTQSPVSVLDVNGVITATAITANIDGSNITSGVIDVDRLHTSVWIEGDFLRYSSNNQIVTEHLDMTLSNNFYTFSNYATNAIATNDSNQTAALLSLSNDTVQKFIAQSNYDATLSNHLTDLIATNDSNQSAALLSLSNDTVQKFISQSNYDATLSNHLTDLIATNDSNQTAALNAFSNYAIDLVNTNDSNQSAAL